MTAALGPEWALAVREAARAFAISRLVVWGAGLVAILVLGWAETRGARLDPLAVCGPPAGGGLGDVLAAPGCRWDSTWYLTIAEGGYSSAQPARSAFFPLYPLLTAAVALPLGGALVPAGLLVSWAASLGFLALLHRTVARARDAATAAAVVRVAAYVPPAIFLSAIYTEALFLLVSLGALVAARRDRWGLAGALGLLAASCRSIGVLLLVPLLVEHLWGRRGGGAASGDVVLAADHACADSAAGPAGSAAASAGSGAGPAVSAVPPAGSAAASPAAAGPARHRWAPHNPVRRDVLWLGLVPLGVVLYAVWLGIQTGDPFGVVAAQGDWDRRFLTPIGGVLVAVGVPLGRVGDLAGLWSMPALAPGQTQGLALARDVAMLGVLVVVVATLWAAHRRMPASWVAWAVVSLAYPLSVPSLEQPLLSIPRFALACFPLLLALGLWAHHGGRMRWMAPLLLTLQAAWSVLFATWTLAA